MKIEHTLGVIVIALMLVDLFLTYKMAYGFYPWESGVSQ